MLKNLQKKQARTVGRCCCAFGPYLFLGKFQWDMGKAKCGNELAIKDAYMRYKGFSNISGQQNTFSGGREVSCPTAPQTLQGFFPTKS